MLLVFGFFFSPSLLSWWLACYLDHVEPCSLLRSVVWSPSLGFHSTVELSSSQVREPKKREVDPRGQGLSSRCSCPIALCLEKEREGKLNVPYFARITSHRSSVLVSFQPAFHKHYFIPWGRMEPLRHMWIDQKSLASESKGRNPDFWFYNLHCSQPATVNQSIFLFSFLFCWQKLKQLDYYKVEWLVID